MGSGNAMDRTPWFAVSIKPARDGMYEVRMGRDDWVFARFWANDGWKVEFWSDGVTRVLEPTVFGKQPDDQWRGLAHGPE